MLLPPITFSNLSRLVFLKLPGLANLAKSWRRFGQLDRIRNMMCDFLCKTVVYNQKYSIFRKL